MKKVLIAAPPGTYAKPLKKILKEEWNVSIVTDGYSTINTMKYLQPDALVLDMNIPGADGLTVLESCFPNIPATTLAISSFASDYVRKTALSLNVNYIMPLPDDLEEIRHRLDDMCQAYLEEPNSARQHLRVLGLETKYDGYRYLLKAIPYFSEDETRSLHKEVYPHVLEQCNAGSVESIEHSIRFAIDKAWEKHRLEIWAMYFPLSKEGCIERPSNKEFISAVAERL